MSSRHRGIRTTNAELMKGKLKEKKGWGGGARGTHGEKGTVLSSGLFNHEGRKKGGKEEGQGAAGRNRAVCD